MTLYHRIAHVERRVPGDWSTAAAELATRVRASTDCAGVDVRLVRLDDEAAIVLLAGDGRDAIARAWITIGAPWVDAADLVLVESAFEGDELLHASAPASDPVDAFVHAIVASSTVWGLYGKTWARSGAAGETEALPVWPDAVAAARCIAGAWAEFAPRAIELSAFCEQWLTGMDEDGIVAVVSPEPSDRETNDRGTTIAASDLLGRITALAAR